MMRHTGTVTSYNPSRGFGWVTPDDVRASVFVHVNDVRGKLPLRVGDHVEYEQIETPKGLKAIDIVILEGAPATGGAR
jgi:cold shock CspA family protein